MNDNNLFPDYEPKRSPDTLQDYLREPSIVFKILSNLPKQQLGNLKSILDTFQKYQIESKNNPGGKEKGNLAIGADLDQYYPSEEELIVSEIGKIIKTIIDQSSKDQLIKYKSINNVPSQKIEFEEICFRHVDVMGSGRFFYAEKRPHKVVVIL